MADRKNSSVLSQAQYNTVLCRACDDVKMKRYTRDAFNRHFKSHQETAAPWAAAVTAACAAAGWIWCDACRMACDRSLAHNCSGRFKSQAKGAAAGGAVRGPVARDKRPNTGESDDDDSNTGRAAKRVRVVESESAASSSLEAAESAAGGPGVAMAARAAMWCDVGD